MWPFSTVHDRVKICAKSRWSSKWRSTAETVVDEDKETWHGHEWRKWRYTVRMGRLWSRVLWSALLLTTLWSLRGVEGHLNLFISQEEVRKLLGKWPVRSAYIFVLYCRVVVEVSVKAKGHPLVTMDVRRTDITTTWITRFFTFSIRYNRPKLLRKSPTVILPILNLYMQYFHYACYTDSQF